MPDLNLIDDEEMSDELPEGVQHVSQARGGGGGGSKVIIILLVLLLVLVGGVYALNTMGIISLWGKQQPQVMTVEEEFPYDESAFAEQPLDTSWMSGEAADDVALLETTPLDEQGAEMQMGGGMAAQMEVKPADEVSPVDAPPTENAELAAMKGDFTVQVVAYREKEKADKILANLEIAGYPAFIEKIPMKGGDWYTVRIGKYATRTAAREAVMTFAEQIRTNYFIDRVRSH